MKNGARRTISIRNNDAYNNTIVFKKVGSQLLVGPVRGATEMERDTKAREREAGGDREKEREIDRDRE